VEHDDFGSPTGAGYGGAFDSPGKLGCVHAQNPLDSDVDPGDSQADHRIFQFAFDSLGLRQLGQGIPSWFG
jgi:hypothetical protein